MIIITPSQIVEVVLGLFTFWIGVHQLSQNIRSSFSWLIFFFFLANGTLILADPILTNAPDRHSYIIWQKITDWQLFFMPTFCLNIAAHVSGLTKSLKKYLSAAYTASIVLFIADLHGNLLDS